MNTLTRFCLVAVLSLSSVAAFAGEKQSMNLNVYQDATIAGVKVPAGEYKMVVERDGKAVNFTLMRYGRKVVTTNARFADLATFSADTAVVMGTKAEVKEIQVSKLKGSIVFDQGSAGAVGEK